MQHPKVKSVVSLILRFMQEMLPTLTRKEKERIVRKQTMLEAARVVFAEKGYAKATLEEIAHRAEFGKGTLYNYFEGGKEELLLEVVADLFDKLTLLAEEVFVSGEERGAPFRKTLQKFIEKYIAHFNEHQEFFLLIIKEVQRIMLSEDEQKCVFIEQHRSGMMGIINTHLGKAIQRGEIRPFPVSVLSHMIIGNIHGYLMFVHFAPSRKKIKEPIDSASLASTILTSFLIHGIGMSPEIPQNEN